MKLYCNIFTLGLLGVGAAFGQAGDSDPFASDDPFRENRKEAKDMAPTADDKVAIVSVCYEAFSLPLKTAASLQRETLSSPEIYQSILQLVASGEAKQEHVTILKGLVGKTISAESIAEHIYPTEYMPVSVRAESDEEVQTEADPENPELQDESLQAEGDVVVAALACAFETRNTGVTFQVLTSVNPGQETMGLLYEIEHVVYLEPSYYGEGLTETEMPQFASQRFNSSVVTPVGEPYFAGTINQLSNNRPEGEEPLEVWFAFLTPKIH